MHYFVVVFGHGKNAVLTEPPQQTAETLRNLIDIACNATFERFPDRVVTSVAPGGVMLAFPDDNPARAEQLCEAVMVQLTHAEETQSTVPPVCAVITHGPMRSVDVFKDQTNFEGPPAIAAARILAELSSGCLAVEESVWKFKTLFQHLGEKQRLTGKHEGEAFSVRIHKHIRFSIPIRDSPVPPSITIAPVSYKPFVCRTGIIQPLDFFNRKREERTLRTYLLGRQHCQIVGPRRIGKTSLLLHLKRVVSESQPTVVVAYLDLQDAHCFTLKDWLAYAGQRLGMTTLPTTLVEFSEGIDALLKTGRHPVLCLDEFEELSSRHKEFPDNFFTALRSCGQRGMSMVTVSQHKLSELIPPSYQSSSFYNIFPFVPLGPFDKTDTDDFVTFARDGIPPFTPEERQAILAFAHGHPLALQVICFHLLQVREEGLGLSDAIRQAEANMNAHLPTWQTR